MAGWRPVDPGCLHGRRGCVRGRRFGVHALVGRMRRRGGAGARTTRRSGGAGPRRPHGRRAARVRTLVTESFVITNADVEGDVVDVCVKGATVAGVGPGLASAGDTVIDAGG